MSSPIISVANLSKSYRLGQYNARTLREEFERFGARLAGKVPREPTSDFKALKDVSFEVRQGEVLGVVGRNGAGKSTLLKILSRVTEPTSGEVRIRGRIASLLEVGTGFHPELTGRENVFLNGAILGMTRAEIRAKFDEIVAFAEVEEFLDTPVKRYSSGMYVRLAFAVAAHLEPEILIVDEVLAVGDAEFQKKCLGKMKDVSTEGGRTVIFVSHNMPAVTSLCDQAIILHKGRLAASGPAAKMVGEYLSHISSDIQYAGDLAWDDIAQAPGNEHVKVRRVALAGAQSGQIERNAELRVDIEYWNLTADSNTMVDLMVYAADGSEVFEDWSADDDEWADRKVPQGLIRTSCTIPAHTFNEGSYFLRIVFFDADKVRPTFDFKAPVGFDVIDTSARSIDWHGRFIGFVRPKLGWTTSVIEAGQ